jgi:hypothetical protein
MPAMSGFDLVTGACAMRFAFLDAPCSGVDRSRHNDPRREKRCLSVGTNISIGSGGSRRRKCLRFVDDEVLLVERLFELFQVRIVKQTAEHKLAVVASSMNE